MPMDPFVSIQSGDKPRNKANLAPGVTLPAARSWRANRPGEVGPAGEQGGVFGNTGPNIGYAMSLARRAAERIILLPGEHLGDALAIIGEIAMKRAASFGRAPTSPDVELAIGYLDFEGSSLDVRDWRPALVHGAGHHWLSRRRAVAAVSEEILHLPFEEALARVREVRSALAAVAISH